MSSSDLELSSSRTGLPPIPSFWQWVSIKDAAADEKNAIVDGPFGSNLKLSDYIKAPGVPVLTTRNLHAGFSPETLRYVSMDKFNTLRRSEVRAGDILVAKIGSCGTVGIYPEDMPSGLIPANLLKITVHPVISRNYLFYYLKSLQFRQFLNGIVTATAQPAFNVSKFRLLPLPLAPIGEQYRIVSEIEKQSTRLDVAVRALKRVQANLKRYRAAVLKAAVEGRLVPTEAELARREGRSYETASELLVAQPLLAVSQEAQAGVPVPQKPKPKEPVAPDASNLPKLPEGWTWARLNDLLTCIRNGISRKPDSEDGVPILRINAVRPRSVDMNEVRFLGGNLDDYADYVLHEGDLLFTRYNGNPSLTGVCGMVRTVTRPTVHPDKLIRVKIVPEICLPAFGEVVLSAGTSRNFIAGRVRTTAGQAGISGADIRNTPIPLAPLSEQRRIVAEVERRLSVIDELEMQVEANLKRAERLRQAILKRAFEGKLVPQDPNDEPASMLLERIKNAKSTGKSACATGDTATPGCAGEGDTAAPGCVRNKPKKKHRQECLCSQK